ncbi:DNA-binding transcriptional MerR regulator [Saccharopolyspora lacisalsi]|uniref:DNA-binding transcriptional MerR regulator n=1 Tax=Halosaccharopolyspora lacisalsi TaxID=1000566 RepID=A0A839E4B0_9PSEU|nr:MerR family transcriptional regulator [Halosaccharopolyspora lacisalsi]MBA8826567.1 DNA-binding transcriptional MerR regulator [Halosaccharopolyspora lacisalsi]
MDDTRLYTIGELARRTGLPVKTIRFYSDSGVVPPTDRTHSGYRLYDVEAVTRLELVRTLRELGAGLDDVRHVLSSRTTLGQLARTHLDLVEDQLRQLTTRRAVLRAVVKQQSTTEEMRIMHELAKMSDEERDRLIDEFWDEAAEGLNVDPEFIAWMRSAKPRLPEDPSAEQLEAWIELAELVRDPGFRRTVRELNAEQARVRDTMPEADFSQDRVEESWDVMDEIIAARKSAAAPDSERARALVDRFAGMVAHDRAVEDDTRFRNTLADEFEQHDPRLTRYWELLATINDWPKRGMLSAADTTWLVAALRASAS